jgi:hypothetical protein
MQRASFAVALVAVGGLASAASAQLIKHLSPDPTYIRTSTGLGGGPDTTTFFDGFESLAVGPINGQAGYTVFAANSLTPVVSTANPAAGSQHLRITKGPGANSSFNGAFTQDFGNFTGKSSTVSVDIFHSHANGADAHIVAQAPGQALLTWRVNFNFGGNIFILDDADGVPGGSLAFINTNVQWTPGVYKNFRVEHDTVVNSLKYYYDNNLIYTGSVGTFAATAVEQVLLFSDNFFNNTSEFVDYDNLSIVPAPGAASLLGFGAVFAARRRRS